MPLYEYRCQDCRRRSTVLVRSLTNAPDPSCEHCGSANLRRLVSKFSFRRSMGSTLDWMPDSVPGEADQEDPGQMADWMRRMKQEMGGEVSPEFESMLGEIESEASGHEHGDEDFHD